MGQNNIDLAQIFGMVTQSLAENQQSLNQADAFNQDHGDNMVQTFGTITNALQQKKGSSDGAALKYAAKQLSRSTTSGSGQLYAQNLAQAASQIQGKSIDAQGALGLLQTLIGGAQAGTQAAQPAGDALTSLMTSLTGADASQPQQQPGSDLASNLLGGLTGGETSGASAQGGLGLKNLMNAGMAFFQAKQSGESSAQALVQAFMAGSGMGSTAHREQSTQMVVNSFLQALTAYGPKA
jgi:hypothetical protein